MYKKIKNFYKRWNVSYNEEKQFEEFKNRVLQSFDLVVGELFLENPKLEERYIKLIGLLPTITYSHISRSLFSVRSMLGYTKRFNDTRIWNILYNISDFVNLIKCIQGIFWMNDINKTKKEEFYNMIKRDIKLSGVQVNIKKTKDSFLLYPKGCKLLDDKLVNDVLGTLSEHYKKPFKNFREALEMYNLKRYNRDIIDRLRLSLELFLKDFLKNKKRLEKQKGYLGQFFKDKNIPKEIINMYITLLSFYTKYQNEYAKHDNKVSPKEAEFLIYLTGSFMRFLLKIGVENDN